MEIGEIGKVANRKRMNVDAEKLREKVSREAAKIIKLKVAQDTVYWDLKEKLQQVEGNHERLQQNMVEVQMQHETISGQYQEELRLRPDTLNKLSSTREICEVLEDYSERLKETLSRCKADQIVLCEAYQKSGQLVRDIKHKQLQADEKNRQVITGLEDKVKMTGDHQKQLLQIFSSSKQQAENEIADLRTKLDTVQSQKEDLVGNVNELNRKIDLITFSVEKKDETISNLQRDMKQLVHEYNAHSAEAKITLQKQEKDLKEALEANTSLKKALYNQEEFAHSLCDEKNKVLQKLALLEEDQIKTTTVVDELKAELEAANGVHESQKNDIANLIAERDRLINIVKEKERVLENYKDELVKLNQQIIEINDEKHKIESDLKKSEEACQSKSVCIDELTVSIQSLVQKTEDMQNTHNSIRQTFENKIKEQTTVIEANNKELDSKASTISQLMSELKVSTDVRSRLEMALQKIKKEIEEERENVKTKERMTAIKIDQLETFVRNKDEELSKQMSIILEMRNEKERLQEKIQEKQNTIDNIQKELTGKTAPAQRGQLELDDNAVMLTPTHEAPKSPIIPKTQFAPREESDLDSVIYHLFSDSSKDGDTLDASEVNRRFEALSRGERVPPAPLGALKRRRIEPARSHQLKQPQDCAMPVSLSQIRNDMRNKGRTFFKNKRNDSKTKKQK